MEILIFIGIVALLFFIGWVLKIANEAGKYKELKPRLDKLDEFKENLDKREQETKDSKQRWEQEEIKRRQAIKEIARQKSEGFPWLAKAFADYFYLENLAEAEHLQFKSHPAPKSAEKVREIAHKRKEVEKQFRVAKEFNKPGLISLA